MDPLIINLKVGNVHSLKSAIDFLGIKVKISNNKKDIDLASHLILPGVGAFDSMINEINRIDLEDTIKENILIKKKPFLGICVGMQVLFTKSEEGKENGLNILKHSIKKLEINNFSKNKIPHVGFSKIFNFKNEGLFKSLENPYFYFTHSYACPEINKNDMNLALCKHENFFLAGLQKENICAVQFHPEKSQSFGIKILSNFFNNL